MKLRLIAAVILAAATVLAQPPDNTGVNKRDKKDGAVTSDAQSNKKVDRELTRKIRHELTENKNMSTYARNIKIITANGMTTLRGPVKSAAEKDAIEAIAKRLAGEPNVDNQLEIAPSN